MAQIRLKGSRDGFEGSAKGAEVARLCVEGEIELAFDA